jgi:hypothetical protein
MFDLIFMLDLIFSRNLKLFSITEKIEDNTRMED